jgi:hypothetical protein
MLTVDVGSCAAGKPACAELALREYGPASFYWAPRSPLSVVDLAGWKPSRVAGCNARRCERLGFTYDPWIVRADHEHDLNALRASAPERQGRSMPDAYLEPQSFPRDEHSLCARHESVVHGVFSPGRRLVAYAQIVQCGDAARFNTILGHADYMDDGAVWLLVHRALEHHAVRGALHAVYYTHDSGHGGGLRYFKERFGFRPARVNFVL